MIAARRPAYKSHARTPGGFGRAGPLNRTLEGGLKGGESHFTPQWPVAYALSVVPPCAGGAHRIMHLERIRSPSGHDRAAVS